ncbi:hypothetical protein, partial [Natronococcus sp. JC468]|uniref:hypothetical protein n=1 Tax=Natronococcus sp. JC468 TaxID=1961921 RepID=UPI001ADFBCA1
GNTCRAPVGTAGGWGRSRNGRSLLGARRGRGGMSRQVALGLPLAAAAAGVFVSGLAVAAF